MISLDFPSNFLSFQHKYIFLFFYFTIFKSVGKLGYYTCRCNFLRWKNRFFVFRVWMCWSGSWMLYCVYFPLPSDAARVFFPPLMLWLLNDKWLPVFSHWIELFPSHTSPPHNNKNKKGLFFLVYFFFLFFSIVLLFFFSNSSHPSLYIPTYTNSKHISATSTSNASIYTHSYTYIYLYSAKSLSIFFFSISLLFSPRFFTFLLCRRAGDGK